MEKSCTKAKLYYSEVSQQILETKFIQIETCVKTQMKLLVNKTEKLEGDRISLKVTEINPYIFEILEIIATFLIRVFDICGTDLEQDYPPKLIECVFDTFSGQLDFLDTSIDSQFLKQIYFEIEFVKYITENILRDNSDIEYKANSLSQKILRGVVSSSAKSQGQKVTHKSSYIESDIFTEEE